MMTPPVYLTRADWGADPVVRSSDGSPRPKLTAPASWITLHYTGNATPLTTKDRAAVVAAQQALERYAAGAGKPNEYNWCLYTDAAGHGYVVEYGGPYQAAHSSGENSRAVGVLFYVGVDQTVAAALVTAYQWLRDVRLYPSGLCKPGQTLQTPHSSMPGAATPCPGPVMYRWDELLGPYDDQGDDEMPRLLVRCGDDPHGGKDKNWHGWIVTDTGKYWLPTNEALTLAVAELGDPVDVDDDWMRAHGPVIGPNPAPDPWGAWTKLPA